MKPPLHIAALVFLLTAVHLMAEPKQAGIPTSDKFPFEVGINADGIGGVYFVEKGGANRRFYFSRKKKDAPLSELHIGATHPDDPNSRKADAAKTKKLIRHIEKRLSEFHGEETYGSLVDIVTRRRAAKDSEVSSEDSDFSEKMASMVLLEAIRDTRATLKQNKPRHENPGNR